MMTRQLQDISALFIAGLMFLLAVVGQPGSLWAASDTRALKVVEPGARKVALVVGNANYPRAPLRNPINDARAMRETLKGFGFDVIHVEDATRRDLQTAILTFAENLANGGTGLFYYAGHGIQIRGVNYLVPVDERITSEASVRFEGVSLDAVLEQMGVPRPQRTNIVILDACRNNPFGSSFGGSGGGLALVDAPTDFLVAYATAPGAVAVDGDQDNGLYTGELLRAMAVPGLRIEDIFKRTRAAVSRQTGNAQIPWEASSLLTDFAFLPDSSAPAVQPVQQSKVVTQDESAPRGSLNSQAVELAFWDAIKDSKDSRDYQAYLESFPQGSFAPLAKSRLSRYAEVPAAQQQALVVPQPAPGPPVEEIEAVFKTTANVNVRAQPTATSKRVARIKQGAKVMVTGRVKTGNWYRVETPDGKMGYIFGGLLAKGDIKSASSTVQKQPQAVQTTKATQKKEPQPKAAVATSQQQAAIATAPQPTPAPQPAPEIKPAVGVYPAPAKGDFRDCPECPEMVALPAGSYTRGSSGGDGSERPVRRVSIPRPFAIGKYEVAYGSWKACMAAGACLGIPKLRGAADNLPVRYVSWTDAQGYVAWLRKKTGRPYRLPSEAEWEYAARGGTTTGYWWGNSVVAGRANCKDCGGSYNRKSPPPVGQLPPNPFNLHDISGGVAEWVADCWHKSYQGAPSDGTAWDKPDCRQRVLRGGSWRNDSSYLRSAARNFYDAAVPYSANGFRVALTLN